MWQNHPVTQPGPLPLQEHPGCAVGPAADHPCLPGECLNSMLQWWDSLWYKALIICFCGCVRWLQTELFWMWGLSVGSVMRTTSWLFQLFIRKLKLRISQASPVCTPTKPSTPSSTDCWSTSGGGQSRTAAPQPRGGSDHVGSVDLNELHIVTESPLQLFISSTHLLIT